MLWLLAVAFIAVASGNVIHDGSCPELKPVENFNVTAYQGTWYEISKYANNFEKSGKCASAEYKLDGEVLKLKNMHVVDGVQNYIEGTAKLDPKANKAGTILVTLKIGDAAREAPLHILATDYNNYAIAYNCKYDEKKKSHEDSAWVLSRTKILEGDAKTAVDNFIKAHSKELDASKLVPTDFSEEACKFNSSAVVTEKPKA